jgi:hypothetical protein
VQHCREVWRGQTQRFGEICQRVLITAETGEVFASAEAGNEVGGRERHGLVVESAGLRYLEALEEDAGEDDPQLYIRRGFSHACAKFLFGFRDEPLAE